MTFIVIETESGSECYPTDTEAEIESAKEAMREAGITEAPVWAGDPDDPDSYRNGQVLFA